MPREHLARFVEEAQITAQLDHPSVMPIHDLGVDPEGHAYFSMKLIRGQSLESIIEKRVMERPEGSYTARLFAQGAKRIAQKVGEEGLEVALAAVAETDDKVISESADLLYHLLVLLKSRGLPFEQVVRELESRHASTG